MYGYRCIDMNTWEKWDITDSLYPGIYEILDFKNNMSYYGESECLCKRYAQHLIELQNGTHYNKSLLQSYQDQNDVDPYIHTQNRSIHKIL
nr:hypothetical protein [Oedogonium angustistomum]